MKILVLMVNHELLFYLEYRNILVIGASLVAQTVYNLPSMPKTWFDPWVRMIPCRKEWVPTQVFFPAEIHGQRSLVGYCPLGHKVGHNRATYHLLRRRVMSLIEHIYKT